MDINLQDSELLHTFDFGIRSGQLIGDSNFIWCVNSKDDSLVIKNIKDKHQISLPYHNFGAGLAAKYSIITGTDFEFKKQKYLLISIEITQSNKKSTCSKSKPQYLLALFKVSTSRVICSFEVPSRVTKCQVLTRQRDFFWTPKNLTFLGNFEISAVCGCDSGSPRNIQLL